MNEIRFTPEQLVEFMAMCCIEFTTQMSSLPPADRLVHALNLEWSAANFCDMMVLDLIRKFQERPNRN